MIKDKIIIAIDGHSSTGKSTFAKLVARDLGYIYIDTGALYRAITLFSIQNKIIDTDNNINVNALADGLKNISITFQTTGKNGESETYLNDENIESKIRTLEVSSQVSYIAALNIVREFIDKILVRIGEQKGVVMDGRDIGTAVFPKAELKIFMTADPEIRAKRRLLEMKEKGESGNLEDVLKNIKERDYIDQNRKIAPLIKADDAILLDNSYMSIEEQLIWIHDKLKAKDAN